MIRAAYIHIPFCEHICHYCDFNKVFSKGQPIDEYLEALESEIKLSLEKYPVDRLETIFVGGGTPTALNEKQLEKLCSIIGKHLPFDENTEYTFEANPGDLSSEKIRILKGSGVNRISFGVQSFNDDLLKAIGRVHRAEDVFRSVTEAKKAGFENISIDLIYSLPGQTIEDFQQSIDTAFTLDISHYSGYSLIIEPKTVFYNLLRKGKLSVPGEDAEASMYELLMEKMDKQGFIQYEISNFAKPGFESRHNLTYWNNEPYFGFGAGAHGYTGGYRTSNIGPVNRYIDSVSGGKLPILDEHFVKDSERMEEEMFLGLRKTAGIERTHFINKFGKDPFVFFQKQIQELQERKWLEASNDHIFLSKKGRLLGNEVFQYFLGVCD
ncbi:MULTISPECIES: radical SAM family heme chaperone HemW [unclassified Bacillus (in: firmicutes)]|uniref:radical SAM family heme chaperone HemW n=1 Tax=unclassified Bacillus (in: firmicutes) TaxID=185979 RepID=UPI0008E24525|nr:MULTISPECIES: radical SAM family heme chaperone HemW [unclassified Bacillus (in: firmicutes)]SFA95500.1 coproporphyrinogen III oxidase, anaerobic [Bacillus sp. UNCCL13]SFQ79136.1 coproporphyrinogen III oxidase, anaerobic [Bacillus sp. cl95]